MENSYQPSLLLIEDSAAIAKLMQMILALDGLDLTLADTGAAGLACAENFRFDLILLNVNLPDMNGVEVCRRLKSNPKTSCIPVLFFTGFMSHEEWEVGKRLGAAGIINKPVNRAVLLATLRLHLPARV